MYVFTALGIVVLFPAHLEGRAVVAFPAVVAADVLGFYNIFPRAVVEWISNTGAIRRAAGHRTDVNTQTTVDIGCKSLRCEEILFNG